MLKLIRSGTWWVYRAAMGLVLLVGLLFSLLVLGLRYWALPHMDDYRDRVAGALSSAVGQRVSIGSLAGHWDGLHPRLLMRGLQVADPGGRPALRLGEVEASLSWYSLLAGELRFASIELKALDVEVRRDRQGRLSVAGMAVDGDTSHEGFAQWLLEQNHLAVKDSRVTWVDELRGGEPLVLSQVDFSLDQFFRRHRFGLRAVPPAGVAGPIDLRGDLRGRSITQWRDWQGRLYLRVDYADLAALGRWFPLPGEVTRGAGSAALWVDVAHGQSASGIADLGLAGLAARPHPGLPPVSLAALRGRLTWKFEGEELEVSGRNVALSLDDGLIIKPANFKVKRRAGAAARPGTTEVEVDQLELGPTARVLGMLPIAADLRARLEAMHPGGTVKGLSLAWTDAPGAGLPEEYALRAHFEALSANPSHPLPGLSGAGGSVEANNRGGVLNLSTGAASLNMPLLFAEPLQVTRLDTRLAWVLATGDPQVRIEHLSLVTPYAELRVAGTWAGSPGAGAADLSGTIARLDGREVWRYLPLTVRPTVRQWLQRAVIAGVARDGSFRLKGELSAFPFPGDHSGVFEVGARIEGGAIDVGLGWPRLEAISGRLGFRGTAMELRDAQFSVTGLAVKTASAQVPDLDSRDPLLIAKGEADIPSAGALNFIHQSPLEGRIGSVVRGWRATGRGQLRIALQVPLEHSRDAHVEGTYAFAANGLEAGGGVPPIEALTGVLQLSEEKVSLADASARMYGFPARLTVQSQAGGGAVVQASGRIDTAGLRRELPAPLSSHLSGTADWHLNANLRERHLDYTVTSDLVGLVSTWPAPFAKRAADPLPLRLDRQQAGSQDLVAIAAEGVSAQLLIDRAGGGVRRGEVTLGAKAPTPHRDGLWLTGSLPRLDLDQWRRALDAGDPGGGLAGGLAGAELRLQTLRLFGRDLHEVQFTSARGADGWHVGLWSREARGDINGIRAGAQRVSARFSMLHVPVAVPEMDVPSPHPVGEGRDLPSIDLVAEDFRFGERQFGSLALLAVPDGQDWRLESLDLSAPEGRAHLTGLWQAWNVTPRTQLKVTVEVKDIGKYLARLKLPQGVAGGTGKLEGQVSWAGPPYALDLPTLSGSLQLLARKGQFVRMDPGFGKLLGVLSLQALPRRVGLDFRDVFSQGFAFDQMEGRAEIRGGVAHTEDFHMQGPAARVELRGEVNMVAETQVLTARVLPALGDGLSLGATLLNPAVGIAAFLAQKVLKNPLDQLLAFEYAISGTWADPTVTPKRRTGTTTPAGRQ